MFSKIGFGIAFIIAGVYASSWFEKGMPAGAYSFGGKTATRINGSGGEAYLEYAGDPATYAGSFFPVPGGVLLDLKDRAGFVVEFEVRQPSFRREEVYLGFEDARRSDGSFFYSRLPLSRFVAPDTAWRKVSIPLSAFSALGEYWDIRKNAARDGLLDWSKVAGVRFSSVLVPERKEAVTVFFRNFSINKKKSEKILPVPGRKAISLKSGKIFTFFDGNLREGLSHYSYGGYSFADMHPNPLEKNRFILSLVLDNTDYSGGAFLLPQSENAGLRAGWALSFWVRSNASRASFYAGLVDDESDGEFRAVESRVPVNRYAIVDTTWRQVTIPLKDFPEKGSWWNPVSHSNIVAPMDWNHLKGVRFSIDRMANQVPETDRSLLKLYFDQLEIIALPDTIFDNEKYWNNFKSTARDTVLENFSDRTRNMLWKPSLDDQSSLRLSFEKEGNENVLIGHFRQKYWAAAELQLGNAGMLRDWSSWEGIRFKARSNRNHARLGVLIADNSGEAWAASANITDSLQMVFIPFRDFRLYEYQPNPPQPDGRFDLNGVHQLDFFSLDYNQEGFFAIADVTLSNRAATGKTEVILEKKAELRYNHIGYATKAPKRILVTDSDAETFLLLDSKGKKVFEGPLLYNGKWGPTGESVRVGDFTEFSVPGNYRLWISDSLESHPFEIGDNWLLRQLQANVKSFYYQRSGVALDKKTAGKWARPVAHLDNNLNFHPSMNRKGTWNAHGGWYDAGDYGKYVVNGGISVSSLLFAEEMFPKVTARTNLLEEARFELEWFLRMQDTDGGVFFKVAPTFWDGFIEPSRTTYPRLVVGKSTTSSLNFAAALAQAHRVYKKTAPEFAARCLRQARRAYEWALQNPEVPFPPYTEGSGAYDDVKFGDEFFWAAVMLWRETDDKVFLDAVKTRAEEVGSTPGADWQNVQNLGWIALALQTVDMALQNEARNKLEMEAEKILSEQKASPYRLPAEGFAWGSNGMLANRAMTLVVVSRWKKSPELMEATSEIVDYIYGRNAVNTSFVTGSAWSSPMYPHHRIAGGDTVEAPLPGLLVGGVNASREDDIYHVSLGVRYPHEEAGKSYYDNQEAYASNETCINWNAALTFVLAALTESYGKD